MFTRNLLKHSWANCQKHSIRIFGGTCLTLAAVKNFREKPLQPETFLHIDINKLRLVERVNTQSLMMDDETMGIKEFIDILYEASNDDNLEAIILDLGYGTRVEEMPLAVLEELHRALVASKKTVVSAHKEIPGLKTLYLSGAATVSHLHPRASFEVSGITEETFFGRRMLDDHRVKASVFKNGKYKSAPSFFSSTHSTPEERENTQTYLKSLSHILWRDVLLNKTPPDQRSLETRNHLAEQWQTVLVKASDICKGILKDIFHHNTVPNFHCDTGPLREILLVDYAKYLRRNKRRALRKEEAKVLGRTFCQSMSHQASLTAYGFSDCNDEFDAWHRWGEPSKTILPIVHVDGELNQSSADTVVSWIKAVDFDIRFKGANIPHVIVRVASPGGDVVAAQKISDALDQLTVPYTVSFGSEAASGGYWISAKAERIFTNAMTMTGSIGVFIVRFDLTGTLKKVGINVETSSTSPLTDIFNPWCPLTATMKKQLECKSNVVYQEFKDRVSQGRKLSPEQTEKVSQGRVFTGEQAVQNGLADQVGGLYEVVEYVKEKHNITDPFIVEYPAINDITWSEALVHSLFNDCQGNDSFVENLRLLYNGLAQMNKVSQRISCGPVIKGTQASSQYCVMAVRGESRALDIVMKQLLEDGSF